MTVEELYEQIGGDYQQAIRRLMNDAFVAQFIVKLLDDPSCPAIVEAWGRGDETATFEAAHMAKGVCGNLAVTSLADLASQITEALRPGNDALRAGTDVDALVAQLDATYRKAIAAITAFAENA